MRINWLCPAAATACFLRKSVGLEMPSLMQPKPTAPQKAEGPQHRSEMLDGTRRR